MGSQKNDERRVPANGISMNAKKSMEIWEAFLVN